VHRARQRPSPRPVIAQSSYQLIGFLRSHLVDVPVQLMHAFNFTQKAISHGRYSFS
jgi:hypothetical protein